MSTFLSTEINILDFHSDSSILYIVMLVLYAGILIGQHYLDTNTHQLHRVALCKPPNERKMCTLLGYNIIRTFVYIINVIFITSNNLGVILVSVLGHASGVYLVYKHQRPDKKHLVHSLLQEIKNPKNDATKKNIAELCTIIRGEHVNNEAGKGFPVLFANYARES